MRIGRVLLRKESYFHFGIGLIRCSELFRSEMIFPFGKANDAFFRLVILGSGYGIVIAIRYVGGKDKW
jgi:hypothetical protein